MPKTFHSHNTFTSPRLIATGGRWLLTGLLIAIAGLALLLLSPAPAGAAPADPKATETVVQPDGTVLILKLWGDEYTHGSETVDGYTVVKNEATGYWEYAVRDLFGNLTRSGVVVDGKAKPPVTKNLRPSEAAISAARALKAPSPNKATGGAADWATGSPKILLIMVQFSDRSCTYTSGQMQTNLFGGGASGPGDLKDFYKEVSNNQMNLQGTVVGCYTMPNTKDSYDNNAGGDRLLVQHAVAAADTAGVDFAPYDNDNNGRIDTVGVIYAGGNRANNCWNNGNNTDNLWPHQWFLLNPINVDGKVLQDSYFMQSELQRGNGPNECGEAPVITTIGLYAHEFGHALNLPDLYDVDQTSEGVGEWSTMGSANWNSTVNTAAASGNAPSHFDPWSKWYMGWLTPVDRTAQATNAGATTPQTLTRVTDGGSVIRLLDNPNGIDWDFGGSSGNGRYFLVENRQLHKFDIGLPGCGIVIWQINEGVTSTNNANASDSDPLIRIVPADNSFPLTANRGDAGDPWPGSGNKTLWNNVTTPNSRLNNGTVTNIQVEFTSACGTTMNLNLGGTALTPTPTPTATPLPAGSTTQNFDTTSTGQLPSGWTSDKASDVGCPPSGLATWAVVSDPLAASPPNSVFVQDPGCLLDARLVSPEMTISGANPRVSFQHHYALETGFDGGVLEISTNGGSSWQDIITAGGSFVAGGYDAVISSGFSSAIGGRQAWTGGQATNKTTTVNVPGANGSSVKFRWRMASDTVIAATGWWVDSITFINISDGASVDTDDDGYPDALELLLGKNPNSFCAIMRGNVDNSTDHVVSTIDLALVAAQFLNAIPPAPERYNQGAPGTRNNTIDTLDLAAIGSVFLKNVSECN